MEFTIDKNCNITVSSTDSIMSKVRLDWTLEEFYASGGVVSFTDRVAGALGIHASNIKTVAVYEGSVVIDFFVEWNEGDSAEEDKASWLDEMAYKLKQVIVEDLVDFGAPILDAITDGTVVVKSETGYFEDAATKGRPDNEVSGGKFENLFADEEELWK